MFLTPDPRRVTRLDRSIVCGKAMARARRVARREGGSFRQHLGAMMREAWAEQRDSIRRRVEMHARVVQTVADIRRDLTVERIERAASFEAYWASRQQPQTVGVA